MIWFYSSFRIHLEYLFWFFQLHLPEENYNQYLKFDMSKLINYQRHKSRSSKSFAEAHCESLAQTSSRAIITHCLYIFKPFFPVDYIVEQLFLETINLSTKQGYYSIFWCYVKFNAHNSINNRVGPTKDKFTQHYIRPNNRLPKFGHPYFHWYFYQNTSVCTFYALGLPRSNLDLTLKFTFKTREFCLFDANWRYLTVIFI